jgi:hypothetical protein
MSEKEMININEKEIPDFENEKSRFEFRGESLNPDLIIETEMSNLANVFQQQEKQSSRASKALRSALVFGGLVFFNLVGPGGAEAKDYGHFDRGSGSGGSNILNTFIRQGVNSARIGVQRRAYEAKRADERNAELRVQHDANIQKEQLDQENEWIKVEEEYNSNKKIMELRYSIDKKHLLSKNPTEEAKILFEENWTIKYDEFEFNWIARIEKIKLRNSERIRNINKSAQTQAINESVTEKRLRR